MSPKPPARIGTAHIPAPVDWCRGSICICLCLISESHEITSHSPLQPSCVLPLHWSPSVTDGFNKNNPWVTEAQYGADLARLWSQSAYISTPDQGPIWSLVGCSLGRVFVYAYGRQNKNWQSSCPIFTTYVSWAMTEIGDAAMPMWSASGIWLSVNYRYDKSGDGDHWPEWCWSYLQRFQLPNDDNNNNKTKTIEVVFFFF